MSASADIWIVKIGGRILEDSALMDGFLTSLASSSNAPSDKSPQNRILLVHGGGDEADRLARRLGIPQRKIKGRRVTDSDTLDIAVMSYAGLLNKRLVAIMQSLGLNAIGMTGADAGIVPARRRPPMEIDGERIDFGWVGDPMESDIDAAMLVSLMDLGLTPVVCAITHDGEGQLLNTNADTMACLIAAAVSRFSAGVRVHLALLFDKPGILMDPDNPATMVPEATPERLSQWIAEGVIHSGMIPKAEMAMRAVQAGVHEVVIGHPAGWEGILRNEPGSATRLHP